MEYEFVVTDEGLVDAVVHDDLPVLRHAVEDCLGTRPPKGAPQDGPSTFWIDGALTRLQARMEDGESEPIAAGNATHLVLDHGLVEARWDFDPSDSDVVDRVTPEELLDFLMAYRAFVMQRFPDAEQRIPPARPARPVPPPT